MRKIVWIAVVVLVLPQAAPAQDSAKALAGNWELSTADREKTCNLSFKNEPAKGGLKVEFDHACANVFPVTREVEAWAIVKDDLRLLDARGRTLFDFMEVESGMYEAERPNEGIYFLQNQASAPPALRAAEEMFGDWMIARQGKTICTVTLTGNGAGGEMGYALRVQPGCDAFVMRLNPQIWRLDRGEIVLSAASGQSLRFAETEPDKWERVPETPDEMTMRRK